MAKYKIDAPTLPPAALPLEVTADLVSFSDGYVKFTRKDGTFVKAVQAGFVRAVSLVENETVQANGIAQYQTQENAQKGDY